jgi:hypothetical protein
MTSTQPVTLPLLLVLFFDNPRSDESPSVLLGMAGHFVCCPTKSNLAVLHSLGWDSWVRLIAWSCPIVFPLLFPVSDDSMTDRLLCCVLDHSSSLSDFIKLFQWDSERESCHCLNCTLSPTLMGKVIILIVMRLKLGSLKPLFQSAFKIWFHFWYLSFEWGQLFEGKQFVYKK